MSRLSPSARDPERTPFTRTAPAVGLIVGGSALTRAATPLPRQTPNRQTNPGGASGGAGIIGAAAYKDTRTNWDPNTASIIVPSTLDYSQGDASGIAYDSGSQSLKVVTDGWYQPWASCKVGGTGSGTTVGTLEVICGGSGGNAIVTVPLNSVYSSTKCYLYTLGEPYFYTAGNTFRADVYADGTPAVSVNAHVGLIALTGP